MKITDDNWVEKIRCQDKETLQDIYSSNRQACVEWLQRNYNLSQEQAVEIFQISVVIMYDNVLSRKLVKANSSLRTYLFSIAKLKTLEFKRRSLRRYNIEQCFVDHILGDEPVYYSQKSILKMNALIDQMAGPCKELLRLFYYNNLSIETIKIKMDYKNKNTVKTKKYKCLKRLKSSYLIQE